MMQTELAVSMEPPWEVQIEDSGLTLLRTSQQVVDICLSAKPAPN
jgi:hypothetical protein